jgi:hypothetical protein
VPSTPLRLIDPSCVPQQRNGLRIMIGAANDWLWRAVVRFMNSREF